MSNKTALEKKLGLKRAKMTKLRIVAIFVLWTSWNIGHYWNSIAGVMITSFFFASALGTLLFEDEIKKVFIRR